MEKKRHVILINGFQWFAEQDYYSPDIKLSETIDGDLVEGHYSKNEIQQMKNYFKNYEYGKSGNKNS